VEVGVAIADEVGAPSSDGTIANGPTAVRKLMTRLGGPAIELGVAYEAGPSGYIASPTVRDEHRVPPGR
jgi:hypothetical protein